MLKRLKESFKYQSVDVFMVTIYLPSILFIERGRQGYNLLTTMCNRKYVKELKRNYKDIMVLRQYDTYTKPGDRINKFNHNDLRTLQIGYISEHSMSSHTTLTFYSFYSLFWSNSGYNKRRFYRIWVYLKCYFTEVAWASECGY